MQTAPKHQRLSFAAFLAERSVAIERGGEDHTHGPIALSHDAISQIVDQGSTVLDLGCGSGDLLALLEREKRVHGQGIEIDDRSVFACVGKGLSVFHGDIDSGLSEYGDKSFDFVILNQSLQQVRNPDVVLKEAMRVGRKVIVGVPNFAHISARFQIFFRGRVPITPGLPYEWYNTPNLHFLSLRDFQEYCKQVGISVESSYFIGTRRRIYILPNLLAQAGVFVITNENPNEPGPVEH